MEEGIHVAIAAEKLGELFGIPITNTLITSLIVTTLLVGLAFVVRGRLAMIPGRLQMLLEETFAFVYDYVVEVLESREMARRFFPLLMTIFLFVFVGNMIHFIPGVGSLQYNHEPFLRAPSTDLTVPLTLAIISFFVIEITGIAVIGAWRYFKKFFDVRSFIGFFVGLVEFIGEFARAFSLAFRLFGNILAGEVIIAVAIFFAPFFGPVPLMLFEIFIGFLQAAIFALLTLFFIKLAITEPHGEEAH